MTAEPAPLDIDRILDVLKRLDVEFLLVGGADGDLDVADRCRELDVLTNVPSRDRRRLRDADLVARAHTSRVHGVAVQVVALPDLIASKEWANRPKDREALGELHRLASGGD